MRRFALGGVLRFIGFDSAVLMAFGRCGFRGRGVIFDDIASSRQNSSKLGFALDFCNDFLRSPYLFSAYAIETPLEFLHSRGNRPWQGLACTPPGELSIAESRIKYSEYYKRATASIYTLAVANKSIPFLG